MSLRIQEGGLQGYVLLDAARLLQKTNNLPLGKGLAELFLFVLFSSSFQIFFFLNEYLSAKETYNTLLHGRLVNGKTCLSSYDSLKYSLTSSAPLIFRVPGGLRAHFNMGRSTQKC